MKTYIFVLGMTLLGVLGASQFGSTSGVIQEMVEVEVQPDWAVDSDAVQAAQDVIRKKELEKERTELKDERNEATTRIDTRLDEIEKELGTYWDVTANVINHIRNTFPEDPQVAIAVASCESGLNADAYNDKNYNDSVDRGLFQLNSTHDTRLGELGLDPWDLEDNVTFARMLYDESGWQPWVCYTKGMLAMNT